MSDPFKSGAPEQDDNVEKKKAEDTANTSAPLNLPDLSSANIKDVNAAMNKGTIPDKSLGRLDMDLSFRPDTTSSAQFNFGQRSQFLVKSDFLRPENVKPIGQYKPMIDDFLQATTFDEKSDDSFSEAEQRELTRSRDSLSNATNTQEAVSNALHLASLYQHLRYIEEAKKAINLSLGIDPDNYHGKQLFKEIERMHPADIGAASAAISSQPLTKSNLRKRINALSGGRVIVIGDLLIDELLEGKPERISREAPVLILEHVDTELIPGGAANTANNISALGGVCHAVGVCGKDEYAGKLAKLFDKAGITHDLVQDASRPTTVKTRILSKSHSFKQQLLRLDRISHDKVAPDIERALLERVTKKAGEFSAIVLSDYRGGVMTDEVIRGCRSVAANNNLMLIVDAQDDFPRFQNVTLLTPNQPDTEKAVGYAINSKETLKQAGDDLMMMTGAKAVLVTRGGEGMVLFQQNEQMIELPAFNKSEVFDVTGAGDTVVATMALALVTGATFLEAIALGNLAAGIVVKKPGTAVTSQKEMLENVDILKLAD
jgi:D-glycero-beta-D-manno-heptose-7-phosphate kinase